MLDGDSVRDAPDDVVGIVVVVELFPGAALDEGYDAAGRGGRAAVVFRGLPEPAHVAKDVAGYLEVCGMLLEAARV